jgi:hypothetical protein
MLDERDRTISPIAQHLAYLRLVKPAHDCPALAGDEREGVPVIQEGDGSRDLRRGNFEFCRDECGDGRLHQPSLVVQFW